MAVKCEWRCYEPRAGWWWLVKIGVGAMRWWGEVKAAISGSGKEGEPINRFKDFHLFKKSWAGARGRMDEIV